MLRLLKIQYRSKRYCDICLRKLSKQAVQPLNEAKHKMQAWQIHAYGSLEELQLTSARIPVISDPNEILIQVKATALNHIDSLMMNGFGNSALDFMRNYELEFPLTLGREFAGTVVDTGREVGNQFKIGDAVYGIAPFHKQGSLAEYIVTDKTQSLLKPSFLNATEAASLLFASITAWSSLYVTGELALRKPDSAKVLILGASGSVGCAAVQILKSQNSLVVGTCAPDAVPLVLSLGADQVYDYTAPEHTHKIASHGRYDIILDCVKLGYKNIPNEWKYNKYVTLDSPLGQNLNKYGLAGGVAASLCDIVYANLDILSKKQSVRWGFFLPTSNGLNFIEKLINNKQLLPVIHKVFKFNEVPDAFKMLAAGHLRGKLVIDLQ